MIFNHSVARLIITFGDTLILRVKDVLIGNCVGATPQCQDIHQAQPTLQMLTLASSKAQNMENHRSIMII